MLFGKLRLIGGCRLQELLSLLRKSVLLLSTGTTSLGVCVNNIGVNR